MTIPTLVTLDQALAHLKLGTPQDGSPSLAAADFQAKIDAATQLVCEHIVDRQPPDAAWQAEIEAWSVTGGSPSTAPPAVVVLAVLLMIGHLDRYRGDDADDPTRDPGDLPPAVKALLRRYHDPAVA